MRFVIALALCVPLHSWAAAQTCKYVQPDGQVMYSNVPQKQARLVMCFDPMPETPPSKPPSKPADTKKKDDRTFPRIDAETQRRRDGDRRRILEQELADEQRLLDEARRLHATSPDASGASQKSVLTHERNIASIRRELENLR
ncbi:MAG: hypothetical protein KIT73_05295 [Burkholderiales bacterium]|nr:hypothetical protein [Burkholderiales bacterium]